MMLDVICICNKPYVTGEDFADAGKPLSNLTLGKRYRAAREGNWFRVWDDHGEDYLYPERMFVAC